MSFFDRIRAWSARAGLAATGLSMSAAVWASTTPPVSTQDLKQLSFEELMNVEITSVSRQPEKLSEAASAVQVITAEDIRRSGATNIPEALRLAPNLQIAQVNASQWAISARGFNNVLANKLLVLIDGRTVYTPFYAGVFWDVQDVLLEDIERIEVVSGPGGTLWGANAVNGIINIITRSALDTQGGYVEAGTGGELQGFAGARYGGRTQSGLAWRVYGKTTHYDDTVLYPAGESAEDAWHLSQVGTRLDWNAGDADSFTLQADARDGKSNPDGDNTVEMDGANVLGRWKRALAPDSELQLQLYYDRGTRDFGNGFAETLSTWDFDAQHSLSPAPRHDLIWGVGARIMRHEVDNLPLFGFTPAQKTLHLYSAFVQDEISLREDVLALTLGAKFEHNDYTGAEWQPSVRLSWRLAPQQTLWAAVSRAVRTPSRLDRDFAVSLLPGFPLLTGSADFDSEEVVASELGWRWGAERLSLSAAAFYNDYDKIRSAEPGAGPLGLPITLGNSVQGHTYGVELSATGRLAPWWQLRGGYTFLKKDLEVAPGEIDLNDATAESNDPEHQLIVQSSMDLPASFSFDTVARWIGHLSTPPVDSYVALDARLAWRSPSNFEVALVGRNLLERRHLEFLPTSPAPREIERSLFGSVSWHF